MKACIETQTFTAGIVSSPPPWTIRYCSMLSQSILVLQKMMAWSILCSLIARIVYSPFRILIASDHISNQKQQTGVRVMRRGLKPDSTTENRICCFNCLRFFHTIQEYISVMLYIPLKQHAVVK